MLILAKAMRKPCISNRIRMNHKTCLHSAKHVKPYSLIRSFELRYSLHIISMLMHYNYENKYIA